MARQSRDRLCNAYAALAAEADADLTTAREWAAKRAAARPLDERAARDLIRLMVAGSDQAGALAAYQRLAARLGAELGVSPAAETRRLVAAPSTQAPAPAAAPAAVRTAGADASRLVGRDGEVRALLRHWRASRAGGGTAVAISGDGGMGKSRLAREVLGVAAADGALTVTAVAGGPGAAAPFALWSELLDDVIAQAGPRPESPPPGEGDWDTPLAAIRTGAPAPATEPGLDRIRFFEATVALLTWAARDRPLALALEDLHAADRPSLELVAYAGRRISRQRVLLVLTRRR
ncbi:MAG TPA: AAA family ATPase, partial [Trebonia sp.]|nr:AAA family ATPase [Trebonia sp.]